MARWIDGSEGRDVTLVWSIFNVDCPWPCSGSEYLEFLLRKGHVNPISTSHLDGIPVTFSARSSSKYDGLRYGRCLSRVQLRLLTQSGLGGVGIETLPRSGPACRLNGDGCNGSSVEGNRRGRNFYSKAAPLSHSRDPAVRLMKIFTEREHFIATSTEREILSCFVWCWLLLISKSI